MPKGGLTQSWIAAEATLPPEWRLMGVALGPREVDPQIRSESWVAWAAKAYLVTPLGAVCSRPISVAGCGMWPFSTPVVSRLLPRVVSRLPRYGPDRC